MPYFLILFFLIYSLFHTYFYCKLLLAYTMPKWSKLLIFFILAILTFTPALIRIGERAGFETFPIIMAIIGFSWMGFLFEFTCIGLFIDFPRVVSSLTEKLFSFRLIPSLQGKKQFLIPATLALLACLYGFFEARAITLRHIALATDKLPSSSQPIKIVQLSDLHVGLTVSQRRLQSIVNTINDQGPDIVVATGDIVESHAGNMTALADIFAEINAPSGKFAVTGNHEYYTGVFKSVDFLRQAGFEVLQNQKVTVGRIDIAGVNDPTAYYMLDGQDVRSENNVLGQPFPQKYTILLKHRPLVSEAHHNRFDLQLSGHSHNGQLFPFNFLVAIQYPMPHSKLINIESGFLYVSSGTGTWGPLFRIFAPPEITIFTLSPSS